MRIYEYLLKHSSRSRIRHIFDARNGHLYRYSPCTLGCCFLPYGKIPLSQGNYAGIPHKLGNCFGDMRHLSSRCMEKSQAKTYSKINGKSSLTEQKRLRRAAYFRLNLFYVQSYFSISKSESLTKSSVERRSPRTVSGKPRDTRASAILPFSICGNFEFIAF